MYQIINNGTITDVAGFQAAGIFAGLKKKKKDLALIYSQAPCSAAGTFTLNKVKAAPLIISQELIKQGNKIHAVLVNSGNANACTGKQGEQDALTTQKYCAEHLGIKPEEVLVSSTGVIGVNLPVDVVNDGIRKIVPLLSEDGGHDAAEAIMTTDLKKKSFAVKVKLSGGEVTIGGICKGSGMIMPNMATMLAFIGTDASIDRQFLQPVLSAAVADSFNKISVDGDTSTNDMVILLANGVSGVKVSDDKEDYDKFYQALLFIMQSMAKAITADGEGATKLITISVNNARTMYDADCIAKSIANSPLVKTALYGQDANWGRILSAAGKSGAEFDPEKVSISFDDLPILKPNYNIVLDEEKAKKVLEKNEVTVSIDLTDGSFNSTWWTCDFSEDYVKINAKYRT